MVEDTAVGVTDEPAADDRLAALEQKVSALQSELDSVREAHRVDLEELLRDLDDLTSRVRRALDS
jgi:hypothetical protein